MISRLGHTAMDTWAVWVVWLTLILPYLAYTASDLRREMQGMPWWMRALLWVLEHTWPYSKCYRLGITMSRWPWRSSFPLRPKYREEQLELPFENDAGQEPSSNARAGSADVESA